jgi:signal transduction histidine kinase
LRSRLTPFAAFIRDLTEHKQAEEALKEAVRARDEFISICSHELKTPVTSMKLQFQMLDRQLHKDDPKVLSRESIEKRAQETLRQLDRMIQLIEEMLDVSRIAKGKLQINPEALDLRDFVREVIGRFKEQFESLGITVESSNDSSRPMIMGDRYRLEQVLSNLLTNAMKYGGGQRVQISVATVDQMARLSVRDHGIGIAKEDLDRVFDRFERAVSATNISGLGLGLYISREIVESHQGRIWAESELGKGSLFLVELPTTHP